MARFLSVKVEMNAAAREFPELWKKQKSLAARAINTTMSQARKSAITDVAQELRLPERIISRRLTRGGASKDSRAWISRRAKPWDLNGTLTVYMRGIPVFQLPGKTKKARAERLARGGGASAFMVNNGKYQGIIFRRIRPRSEGNTKSELEVPRIHVERALRRRFGYYIDGPAGIARFRRNYLMLLQGARVAE